MREPCRPEQCPSVLLPLLEGQRLPPPPGSDADLADELIIGFEEGVPWMDFILDNCEGCARAVPE